MQSRKLPKRLFKSKDVVHAYQHDRMLKAGTKHLERDHIDVLRNIETAIVRQAGVDPTIDDAVIDQALGTCAAGANPPQDADPRLVTLFDVLKSVRSPQPGTSDLVWEAALRKIHKSVRLHSNLTPGETSYLDFVSPYVRQS